MSSSIKLSESMLREFNQNAYLTIDAPIFSKPDFIRLRNYLLSYVMALPEETRGTYFTGNQRIRRPYYQDWVSAPPIVDIAEQILGPNLAYFNFALCYKPPRSQFRVGPHIDSHYWIKTGCIDPDKVLTVFISLTPTGKDEGCLRVLPGINDYKEYSHRKLDEKYNFFHWEIDDKDLDLGRMVDVEMAENRICLLKSGLVHESGCNNSNEHRLGLTIRYIAADAIYKPIADDPRKMLLLRGKNIANNHYYEPNPKEFVGGFSWST